MSKQVKKTTDGRLRRGPKVEQPKLRSGKIQTLLRLEPSYRALLEKLADDDRRSLAQVVEWLVREEIARRRPDVVEGLQ